MDALCSQELQTPVGRLLVAATPEGVCRLCFPVELSGKWFIWFDRHFAGIPQRGSSPLITEAVRQLEEYFGKGRRTFDVPLDLRGTPFQVGVWKRLTQIPYGSTVSYGELARKIGNRKGARAVGSTVAANPIPIIVPCHRVVGYNGALVGFGGGLTIKEQLLELEGSRIPF